MTPRHGTKIFQRQSLGMYFLVFILYLYYHSLQTLHSINARVSEENFVIFSCIQNSLFLY